MFLNNTVCVQMACISALKRPLKVCLSLWSRRHYLFYCCFEVVMDIFVKCVYAFGTFIVHIIFIYCRTLVDYHLPLKSTRYCTKPTKQTLYWTFTNQWILLSKQTLPKVGTQLRVGRLSSIYKFILYHKYYLCPFCPDRIDISPWNCLPHKLIFMHNVKKCM